MHAYVKGVMEDHVIVNADIKKAVQNFHLDQLRDDLEFRKDAVTRVFKFAYFTRLIHNNEVIRFDLLPFQTWVLAAIFGFYYKGTEERKIREAILFMGKGNGKSPLAAFLINYFMIADGVIDPQALILANTRDQARISLDFCKKMVYNSPALNKRLQPYNYRIMFKNKRGTFNTSKTGFAQVMSSEIKSMDGYAANGAILDEVHEYNNANTYNMIKGAVAKRNNSLLILITTAGTHINGFLYNKLKYYRAVLLGDIKDESVFCALYCLDEKDDYTKKENWYKANPALDQIFPLKDLEMLFESSKFSKSELDNFMTKRMNEFVDAESAWIPNKELGKVFVEHSIDVDLIGEDCWVGVDFSETRDLTSVVCVFHKDGKFYVKPYFFMPNNQEKLIRIGGINIKEWIEDGWIQESQLPSIDHDQIVETFKKINQKYVIKSVYYDPANSEWFLRKILNEGIGVRGKCKPFQQKATLFNTPLKYLEKLIFDEQIIMENPALRWNFNNCILYSDGNANIKIMKNKSADSVDGAVALGMAIGGYLDSNKGFKDLKSLYEQG